MTSELRIVQDSTLHTLGFAVRFDDHFTRVPVPAALDVVALTAAGREIRPTRAMSGSYRHDDGTYRFLDLPDGNYPVVVRDPSATWVSWDPELVVAVPRAKPGTAVARDLWPASTSVAPVGVTALRAKLRGSDVRGLKVEITGAAAPAFDRFTQSDASGELLFLQLGRVPREANKDRIKLRARVAGGARGVSKAVVLNGSGREEFLGADFEVVPGRTTRVFFTLA